MLSSCFLIHGLTVHIPELLFLRCFTCCCPIVMAAFYEKKSSKLSVGAEEGRENANHTGRGKFLFRSFQFSLSLLSPSPLLSTHTHISLSTVTRIKCESADSPGHLNIFLGICFSASYYLGTVHFSYMNSWIAMRVSQGEISSWSVDLNTLSIYLNLLTAIMIII